MNSRIPLLAQALLLGSCVTLLTPTTTAQLQAELAKMVAVDQVAVFMPQGKYQHYTRSQ